MQETKTINKLDIDSIRQDFPVLSREINGKPLVYFDNAATSQKPKLVIDAITDYYCRYNANIHRGVYTMSAEATEAYDNARENVRRFINAAQSEEIIFTRGATEAINLVAYSYGRANISEGDEIIVSEMEHHANIVPWQVLCNEKKAKLVVLPVSDSGELSLAVFENLITSRTKLVAISHVSNTLGTVNPVKKVVSIAHSHGVKVLVDGAQAVMHSGVDVQNIDADFYAFSGHKMFAPMGIGVLYGKAELLEEMPPYQTGGDMISSVKFSGTTYNEIPMKFEAGTPNVEGAVGLNAAINYLKARDTSLIEAHEHELLEYATEKLLEIEGLRIIGTAAKKISVVSFVIEGLNPMDIGIMLDTMGVAVRTGQHCTEPLMDRFGIPATVRASMAFYNTLSEVDSFTEALKKTIKLLK